MEVSRYLGTVLVFRGDPEVTIDLRGPIGPEMRQAILRLGVGVPLTVVTPCNPRGVLASPADNAQRVAAMQADLIWQGVRFVPTDGRSPDARHMEHGFAFAATQEQAVAAGRTWDQDAVFWYDGERVWLTPAMAAGAPTPLPKPRI